MITPPKPSALLLMSPQCSHCPAVMESLLKLLKRGQLARVEMVNLFEQPDIAAELGVRSVPWTRIGPFELEGAHSFSELEQWTQEAAQPGAMSRYYSHLLENQQLDKVIAQLRTSPETLVDLIPLLADLETPMAVRIGVGAIYEEFAGDDALNTTVDGLIELTRSDAPQIRADACHYLGLTRSDEALEQVLALTEDPSPEIAEIAHDSATALQARLNR